MCGIYFSYTQYEQNARRDQIYSRLKRRGPDCSKSIYLRSTGNTESFEDHDISNYFYLSFHATLLSLRGSELTEQPLEDLLTGSILCWNGEAWKINDQNVPENDSKTLFARLLNAAKPHIVHERKSASSDKQTTQAVTSLLANVAGPAAFVFFDAQNERIFYGRDVFGRRSLLQKRNTDGDLYISSVRDVSDGELWDEVKAGGIYMLELARSVVAQGRVIQIYDHTQVRVPTPW